MSECEQCGREVRFPFGCCYCRKPFCSEHVLPKNHGCPKLYQELKYWHQKKKAMEGEIPSARVRLAFCIILILLSATIAHASYHFGSRELRDPTYQEALQFIEIDQTDKNLYLDGEYTCTNFATDFRDNALKAGYKCGFVLVFSSDWNHALNCFNTTDYGLIFVEPQEDEIVTLTVGKPYWDRTKYASPPYNDTVTSFLIDW